MTEQVVPEQDAEGKNPEETVEQKNMRFGKKCADYADALSQELLAVLDKHRQALSADTELNSSIVLQIMSESVASTASPVIMSSADYHRRIAELQNLPDIGEAAYILSAQADFANGLFKGVAGMVQRRAIDKLQKKSPLVGV